MLTGSSGVTTTAKLRMARVASRTRGAVHLNFRSRTPSISSSIGGEMKTSITRARPSARTSSAATEPLDSAFDAGLGHPESPCPTRSVALQTTPPAFLDIPTQGLAEQLALGATFLFGDSLGLTDQVRGQRQRQDPSGAHGLAPVNTEHYIGITALKPWRRLTPAFHIVGRS